MDTNFLKDKRVKAGIGAVLLIVIVLILILVVYKLMGFQGSEEKKGFQSDRDHLDPLVKFYLDNSNLRSSFEADFNANIDDVLRVYNTFLANPGKYASDEIINQAKELVNFIQINSFDFVRGGETNSRNVVRSYLITIDRMLTQIMESISNLSDGIPELRKVKKDFLTTNVDIGYGEYLKSLSFSNNEDVLEDAMANLQKVDYDPSRYTEALTEVQANKAGSKSTAQHLHENGHEMKFRPFPGAHDNRQIAIDTIEKETLTKDYAIPKPGVITGRTQNIESYNDYYDTKIRLL